MRLGGVCAPYQSAPHNSKTLIHHVTCTWTRFVLVLNKNLNFQNESPKNSSDPQFWEFKPKPNVCFPCDYENVLHTTPPPLPPPPHLKSKSARIINTKKPNR